MSEQSTHPDAPMLFGKIMELKQALDAQVPDISGLMRTIHEKVKNTPELCMVLTEEQIAITVRGYEKQSQTIVIAEKMKSPKKIKGGDITPDMIS